MQQTLVAPLPSACKGCGLILEDACYTEYRAEKDRQNIAIATAAKAEMRAEGRDPSHGGESARKRGASIAEQLRLNAEWEKRHTSTMTETEYLDHVLSMLATVEVRQLAEVLGVSRGYAATVRKGLKVPHPRHWLSLIEMEKQNNSESKLS